MKNRLLSYSIVFGGLIVTSYLLIMPVFIRARCGERKASCQSNLKNLYLGFAQYTQDYDGRLPIVVVQQELKPIKFYPHGVFGWADALDPYIKSKRIFICPTGDNYCREPKSAPHEMNYTDYYFNSQLDGISDSKLKHKQNLILAGDGNDGTDTTNARYSKSTLPHNWINDLNSPANRHLEGANYAFADGHVKWLKPNRIKEVQPNGKFPTFAVP